MGKAGSIRTKAHGQLIEAILTRFPGAQTRGFKQAYIELEKELEVGDPTDDVIRFIPDAYRINRDTKRIEIFEVEVTYPLPTHKINALGMIWFYWDCEANGWEPVLYIVNRYGLVTEMDLQDAYYGSGPFGVAEHLGTLKTAVANPSAEPEIEAEIARLQEKAA